MTSSTRNFRESPRNATSWMGEMVLSPTVPPRYSPCSEFRRDLEARVAGYFDASQRSRQGSGRMYLKTAILMTWLVGSYVGLVWGATVWWQVVPLAISLALAMAGVGFNVQHDGNHGAYSRYCAVNKVGGADAEPAGGRRLLLALQAQHRPPHLSERDRLRRRHSSRPAGAPVAAPAALLVPPLPAPLRLGPLRAAGAQLADLGRLPLDRSGRGSATRRSRARAAGISSASASARRAS